jgi:signal transduction histidine kinase
MKYSQEQVGLFIEYITAAIACYPDKLNQVFVNLLSNAIDALEESVCK